MSSQKNESLVLASRGTAAELPIPTAWRPAIRDIVHAFSRHDYQLSVGVPGVTAVSAKTAEQIRDYIQDYGEELMDLPEESWDSSVCVWQGARWDALIDLWTLEEGRSDLVLSLQVAEVKGDFEFTVYMVYVP